ncbi:MAG: hypothetical protein C4523_04070 [Myxococcales bacterium]|nr:MAG: hypothetical protein C4523_04070 [Myxococcales bacterium]
MSRANDHPKARNAKREALRALLSARDHAGLGAWAQSQSNPASPLIAFLFEPDLLLCWRAIEALGGVARATYADDPERWRNTLRRLLWHMNEESGGIIWLAPEAAASVLRAAPDLIAEYGNQLLSRYADSPFERGVRWAAAYLAPVAPELAMYWSETLSPSLENADAAIRGLTAAALKDVRSPAIESVLAKLRDDNAAVELYDFASGEFGVRTVADLTRGLS